MRIEYLREFERLAVALNYTKVAKHFNISTSTLSKHIVAVEREVGQQLFVRSESSVSLTPAGRRLFEGISPILEQYDALIASLRPRHDATRRQLTLHVGVRAPRTLALLAKAMHVAAEGHDIEVSCPIMPHGVKYLTNLREADATVVYRTGKLPAECLTVPLLDDPFVAVVPKSHPLAGRETLSIRRDLAQTRVVRLKSDFFKTGQDAIFEAFDRCGVEPPCTYSLVSSFDDPALVYDLKDVLILPQDALRLLQFATPETHDVLHFEDEEAVFHVVLAYLPAKESAALRTFVDVLTACRDEG